MVGVGEMLAGAAVAQASKLLALVLAPAGDQLKMMWTFKEDVEKMKDTLESMQAVLMDAEKLSITEEGAKLWLKRLKKAAYDISDMFEELDADKPASRPLPRISIMSRHGMAKKIKKMNKRLDLISDQRKIYDMRTANNSVDEQKKHETTSRVGSDMIVDLRRDEQEEVIKILFSTNSSHQEINICTVIYGFAGVGKTELAKAIFNDDRIQKAFPLLAWVYLRENLDIDHIGRAIISEIEGGDCKFETRQSISRHLDTVLSSRCLIVLDNLCNDGQLTGLEGILDVNKVSILITSRSYRAIKWNGAYAISFKLEPLSEIKSLALVKHVASPVVLEGGILETAMEMIVEKCKGVPLAIKALASLLKKERGNNNTLLESIEKSFLGESSYEQTVMTSLKLTYHPMPWHLKSCFAYCAIFPKGCEISWEDLYHQWIALGLIQGSLDKLPMIAEGYIRELLDMSFLQDSAATLITKKSSRAPVKLKMHDLVHDLALSVADDELVVMIREKIKHASDGPRHALLVACEELNFLKHLPAKLRALHMKDCPILKFKWHNFSFIKCLRILDISGCCIDKLPSSIGKFAQLRYLNASGIQDKEFPEGIGSLSKLQYLNLHGSKISALPESASKLGGLMHLDLSECVDLHTLPKSFNALERLSLLNLEKCSELRSLPDDLSKFKNLEILNLSGCSKLAILPESLGKLSSLRQLDLSDCQKLGHLPNSFSRLTSLQYLNMSSCFELDIPVDALTKLVKLEYLNMSSCPKLLGIPEGIGSLSKLQYLNLHGSKISALPESASKLGGLMHLDLSECVDLHTLPKSFNALELLSLLNLEKCSELRSLPDDLSKHKNLEILNLSGCSKLAILPESLGKLSSLRQLDLSDCQKLGHLPNSFSRLTSLQYLNMSSCFELDIPVDALTKLVKLEYLNMSCCPKLLGIPEEFCSLNLHTLNLSDCSNLKDLPESLWDIRFIALDGCEESLRKSILEHRFSSGRQSLPSFIVQVEVGSTRSNIYQLERQNFSELELYQLENTRRIDEAEAIKMSTRSGLRSLGLKWSINVSGFVEDEALLRVLEPPEDLQKFRVQGYKGDKFPKWEVEIGSRRRVQLGDVGLNLPMCNSLPPLGQLENLQFLHLSWMPKITRLDMSFCGGSGGFRKLRTFTLEYMENLEEWCTTVHEEDMFMFPGLKELNIFSCPRLILQPCPPRSIEWHIRASEGAAWSLLKRDEVIRWLAKDTGMGPPFTYTTELHVSDSCNTCHSRSSDGWKFHGSLIALKDSTCGSCSSIDTLLGIGSGMQCLVILEISGIEDVKSLQEQVETVGHSTRSSLTKSTVYWTPTPASIKGRALLHLKVRGYATSGVIPSSIEDITSFLQNLIRINMDELPMCDRLPPLGQLPRLQELRLKGMPKIRKIDREFCGGNNSSSALFFPNLSKFVLNDMPNLEEWATKVSSGSDRDGLEGFMFPRLVKLAIWNCPKLKLMPCPPRAVAWDINNSNQVIASSYDTDRADELATTLQVILCNVPPNGWRLLCHLPRIQNLAIISCRGMEALPESVQSLSSLQSLTISKCDDLKHLPEWLGDLISLENLMVVSCPMEFLPGSLRRLTFLRSLTLSHCNGMAALPGWLGDLTSLRKLTIEGCKSLKSLPQLTNLEDLLIGFNDELKQWCESEANLVHIKRKGFWLDSPSGSNSCMLPARSLFIAHADNDKYWKWLSVHESRFAEAVELLEVWWLQINGWVPKEALSADTSYDVYLVYKLADKHEGLSWAHVDGHDVSFVDEDAVRVGEVAYPVTRSEGWMELRLGEFHNKRRDSEVTVCVGVWETDRMDYAKKGLIIEGMEIRAKSVATS